MIVKLLRFTIICSIFFFAGCGASGDLILEDSKLEIENSLKTIISDYKASSKGLVKIDYNVEVAGFETPESNLNIDGNLKLQFKEIDEVTKNSNVTLNLLANLKSDDVSGLLAGELRFIDKVLYFNLSKVPTGESSSAASQLNAFVGKWYGLNLAEGFDSNPLVASILNNNTIEAQSDTALKMKELYMNAVFYKSVKLVSTKGGVETYKLVYDNAAILNYMVKSSEIQGTSMSKVDVLKLKEMLDTLNLETTLSVKDDLLVTMLISFNVVVNKEKGTKANGTVTMNFEQELDDALFEAPTEAVKLN